MRKKQTGCLDEFLKLSNLESSTAANVGGMGGIGGGERVGIEGAASFKLPSSVAGDDLGMSAGGEGSIPTAPLKSGSGVGSNSIRVSF